MIEEMLSFIKLLKNGETQELTGYEWELFCDGFKKKLDQKRDLRRLLLAYEHSESKKGNLPLVTHLKTVRGRIEANIETLCEDALHMVHTYLAPHAASISAQIRCSQMQANFYRYLTTCGPGQHSAEHGQKSLQAYDEAFELAEGVSPFHHIRFQLCQGKSILLEEYYGDIQGAHDVLTRVTSNANLTISSLQGEHVRNEAKETLQIILDDQARLKKILEGHNHDDGAETETESELDVSHEAFESETSECDNENDDGEATALETGRGSSLSEFELDLSLANDNFRQPSVLR